MKRSRFLHRALGAAGATAMPLAPSLATAADLTKMHVGAIAISDCAPFFAAIAQGGFAANGLDVVTEAESGGVLGIPAVVAGAYDIVYTNLPSALLAISQGIDLRFVAGGGLLNPPDTTGLFVRKGERLRAGKDFEGKTIGVNDTRGLQWMYARGWVTASGGNPEKVGYHAVAFPQMADALKNKYVDGIIPSEPFTSVNRSDPALTLIANPGRVVFPRGRVAAWVAMNAFTVKSPDLIRRFIAGMTRGAQWVNANLNAPAFVPFVASYTKLDPSRVAAMAKGPASVEIAPNDLRRMADLMRTNGVLTLAADFDPAAKIFAATR